MTVCRNLLIALALAALTLSSANGSPASPATAQKTASPPSPVHKKAQHKPVRAAARPQSHARIRPSKGKQPPAKTAIKTASKSRPVSPKTAKAGSLPKAKTAVPPPLRGSRASLARQNAKSDAEGLERIEDEEDLKDRIARKLLVPVPVSSGLKVSASLAQDRRYCRPWTATFLNDLARAHAAQFHRPLEVNSAVRTVAYQKRLLKTNGNAAAAEGGIVSPHVTGATIDLSKQGITRPELGWMRRWLTPLQKAGKIDVEEEFQQACFHITVYKSYVPPKPAHRGVAPKSIPPRATRQPHAAPRQQTQVAEMVSGG